MPVCVFLYLLFLFQGRRFTELLEVSLRAALAQDCACVVVLNPHAIGVTPEHIHQALSLLQDNKVTSEFTAEYSILMEF